MTLGQRIQTRRDHQHLGLRELAREAGVDAGLLSKLESGVRQRVTLEVAKKLARALGVSIDYLAGMYDDENATPDLACTPAGE